MMRHLYLIRDGEGSYKIGSAKDPKERLDNLQVGSCRRLALVWSIQTELALWIEDCLHRKFRSQRIIGEWFSLNAEEVQWIMSLTVEEIHRLRREEKLRNLCPKDEIHRQKRRGHRLCEDVTDAELALLQVLWDSGPVTIRQLTGVLYPGGGAAQYATVQKLLERLENKGFVRRDRSHLAHTFTAATARDDLIGRRLHDRVVTLLCGGSLTPLLTHLVRTEGLTSRELLELRCLIDESDPKCKGKKRLR